MRKEEKRNVIEDNADYGWNRYLELRAVVCVPHDHYGKKASLNRREVVMLQADV